MPRFFRFGLILSTLLLLHLCPAATSAAATEPQAHRPVTNQTTTTYENITITEDVIWRGSIIVKGAMVVAPQATLRIEPGTKVRFLAAKQSSELPRLVVMGRIEGIGTPEQPILFGPASTPPVNRSEWGGIVLLSSEKRNQLEHCRFEGAETAFEGRFSNIMLKSVEVTACNSGIVLHDSTVVITKSNVSECETGIEAHNTELEVRDTSVTRNLRGLSLFHSSVVLTSLMVNDNSRHGILAEDGRIKLTDCQVSGNAVGAYIRGVEGMLFNCRFMRNKDTALHLAAAYLKINRCQITDNLRDGLKLEDGRASIWDNAISGNGGYNIVNAGPESISALQNWWGSGEERSVRSKLFNSIHDGRSGVVNIFPWLLEMPEQFR